MTKRYTGTFVCVECGEEWELVDVTELKCQACSGRITPVGHVEETDDGQSSSESS